MGFCTAVNFTIPVHKGESQGPSLGTKIECINEETGESVEGENAEIVVSTPTPSMIIGLFGDNDGAKLREKYFSKYPGKFLMGDNGIINPVTRGLIVCGRSDETLKQRGCRFGSSDIYNVVVHFEEVYDSLCVSQYNKEMDERAVLFLQIRDGYEFTDDLVDRIRERIAEDLTPRHVPDLILETQEIPYNENGKKMEILIKKIINNMPCNTETTRNPDCLEFYRNVPELQDDF